MGRTKDHQCYTGTIIHPQPSPEIYLDYLDYLCMMRVCVHHDDQIIVSHHSLVLLLRHDAFFPQQQAK